MRVQIVRDHAQKIGVDYEQVRAVFQQAGANGHEFNALADEFLGLATPEDFIQWGLQYEPVPDL